MLTNKCDCFVSLVVESHIAEASASAAACLGLVSGAKLSQDVDGLCKQWYLE